MPILAFVFAATWFVTGGMAAHLPRLLEIAGATPAAALAAAALVGPAQVGARMVEFSLLRLMHPLVSARLTTLLHPLGGRCSPYVVWARWRLLRSCTGPAMVC